MCKKSRWKETTTTLNKIRLNDEPLVNIPQRENSFDYGPQRSDESNEAYKKRMEFLLEPPKSDSSDYGPQKSDESDDSYERRMRSILGTHAKKAEGVDDDVKVINIKKDDTSNNEQLIGEDLSLNIPEIGI